MATYLDPHHLIKPPLISSSTRQNKTPFNPCLQQPFGNHMTTMAAILSPVLLALLLGGCASPYVEPQKDAAQTTLHIVTNHPHLTMSSWLYYSDAQCSKPPGESLGNFTAMYAGEKKIQLKADEKKYLVVRTLSKLSGPTYSCGAPLCDSKCSVEFEIVPSAGRTYRATQSGNGMHCAVQIIDEVTGAPAEGVRQIPTDQKCKG
ncbi:hypothetical protein [Collimonas pratensis]|uniref:hypothetical protein n=1 Tax=Collimonas pratensis TaxID=279113 RepID=UPI000A3F5F9B|nr:hypothetical protein [Collimonas pratensis]